MFHGMVNDESYSRQSLSLQKLLIMYLRETLISFLRFCCDINLGDAFFVNSNIILTPLPVMISAKDDVTYKVKYNRYNWLSLPFILNF